MSEIMVPPAGLLLCLEITFSLLLPVVLIVGAELLARTAEGQVDRSQAPGIAVAQAS